MYCEMYYRIQNMKIIDGKPEYKGAAVSIAIFVTVIIIINIIIANVCIIGIFVS